MPDVKTSQDVGYTPLGELGKQCKDCTNYVAADECCGNCFGHNVQATGSCNLFQAK